jgi:hypothetical protein
MPQAGEQHTAQTSKERPHRAYGFQPGKSGNPAGGETRAVKEARLAGIITAWCQPYGGITAFNPAEHTLIRQAAELSLRHKRTADDHLRIARTISKLLMQVGIATGRKRAVAPDPFALTITQHAGQAAAAQRASEPPPITREAAGDRAGEAVWPAVRPRSDEGGSPP